VNLKFLWRNLKMRYALSMLAILAAGQATAQDGGWTYSATLYGWFPGADLTLGTPRGDVSASLSSSDTLNATDFAFMGAITAQGGPIGLVFDAMYFDLSDNTATPGPAFDSATLESQINITNIYALYQVMGGGANSVDVGIGYRFYQTDNAVTLSRAGRDDIGTSSSDNWSDPLIALRYRGEFADNMYGLLLVDYGGFLGSQSGSDNTWQGLAAFGYRFNDNFSAQLGYRYLQADRSKGANNVDVSLSGPVIGVTYTF
jgi:opacity protein-like surface antigen